MPRGRGLRRRWAATAFGTALAGNRRATRPREERTLTTPSRFRKTCLAALLLGAFAAEHAAAIDTYAGDPGTLGNPASWRTPEFDRDWGLR